MRTLATGVLVAVAIFIVATRGFSAVEPPFALQIAPVQATAHMGEEIAVVVTMTNTSIREITFFENNPDCDFDVEVRHADGTPAVATEYKRNVVSRCATTKDKLVHLRPSESVKARIVITRLYDMTRPGRYRVQVSRRISAVSPVMVKSPMVVIAVT